MAGEKIGSPADGGRVRQLDHRARLFNLELLIWTLDFGNSVRLSLGGSMQMGRRVR